MWFGQGRDTVSESDKGGSIRYRLRMTDVDEVGDATWNVAFREVRL